LYRRFATAAVVDGIHALPALIERRYRTFADVSERLLRNNNPPVRARTFSLTEVFPLSFREAIHALAKLSRFALMAACHSSKPWMVQRIILALACIAATG
jgi:hypothetical protein